MKRATKTKQKRQTDAKLLRRHLVTIAEAQAVGSREPAQHTHIECFCQGYVHRRDDYDEGCFCPECAAEHAVKLGYPSTDTRPENEGPDDSPQWCEECDVLITLRSSPDLDWGISPRGALEELEYYEKPGLGFDRGEPSTPDQWQVFLLVIDSIADEYLPRVVDVVNAALARSGVSLLQRRSANLQK